MSRGFVKEGDQEEAPIIPPRAALPDGVPNYVTPEGFELLKQEKEALLKELTDFDSENEREKRRKSAEINGKLNLLNERINSARILDVKEQGKGGVRFGSIVTYQIETAKKAVTIKIVGVDEADTKKRKIAFIAPLVKAMIGKQKGESFTWTLHNEKRTVRIIDVQ